ncbi:MAG: hypothetical protein KF886_26415 [Candidatus Hydrogenedentes bacterium]|nr:hypothetical protein [Candidatus Hydrogenedentota bacterium]
MANVSEWIIDPNDAAMLLTDHRSGLFQRAMSIEVPVLRPEVTALAKAPRGACSSFFELYSSAW